MRQHPELIDLKRTITNGLRPAFDHLDARRLLAARLTAALTNGVLTVKGTASADVIAVNVGAEPGGVVSIAGLRRTFQAGRVRRIEVMGAQGDDAIAVQTNGRPNLAVRIVGGAGNDTINGVAEAPTAAATRVAPLAPIPASSAPAPTGVNLAPPSPAPAPTPTPAPTAVATTAPVTPATVQRIVDLTNAERARAGLAPLALDAELTRAAEIQSGNMARLDVMSHTLPGTAQPGLADRAAAVGYRYASMGENIAYNYGGADEVVAGWMGSPGHRANILNPNFTQIGVAVATNAAGQPYYTQVFGAPA